MYLTIALFFWFLHYMYYTRARKRFKVLLFEKGKFLHEYRTNLLPAIDAAIFIFVDGIKKAYLVKGIVLRMEDKLEEVNLNVIDLKTNFNEPSTPNTTGTTIP